MTNIQIVKATCCRNPIVGTIENIIVTESRSVVNFKMKSKTYYEE